MEMFDIDQDVVFESVEEREARESRIQQNELAPIARLPPEILADIFVRCVPVSMRKVHSDLSWLNLTRVSSGWRNVALACPDFWSTVILSRPKWTPVMLARSKMASLIVRADLRKDHDNSPEPILLDNAARLGILDIRSPQHYLTTFVSNLEHAEAAPRLQYIRIVNTDADAIGKGGMCQLPQNLFRRREVLESGKSAAQASVRLHLEACAFPWDSGWYTHVTHLHLENIALAQRPTMETLLGILVDSPALQTLAIIHCSPTTRHGFPVYLPHLTALTLKSDSSTTCGRLLGFLTIPPSATVNASCNIKSTHDTHHPLYHSLIPEFSDVKGVYDTVRIIHREGLTYSLLDSARPEWLRKLRIEATVWNFLGVTKTIVEHLDFSNVTTLHLQGMRDLHQSDEAQDSPSRNSRADSLLHLWDTMGRTMCAVRTLHLHRSFPARWLEFLLTQAMLLIGVSHLHSCFNLSDGQTSHGSMAFRGPDGALTHAWPALTCLALHGLSLGEWDNSLQPAPSDLLRALLWARRAGRAPIWQLEIEDCERVYSTDVAHFRLFADVVYDGKGGMTVEKEEDGEELSSYSINVFSDMIEQR
ncbi:hypothetical protein DFH07DRAFT_1055498 [Mycena maculata]|uniref:F-box domain-containing protein n=1 Tax=Mycena maculata TaxID=230809 RepID=A0AAD7KFB9_9AGAR|nr:hypothetical protein DFH07DRAFT_1055498 [Mycena maculata]